MVRKQAKSIELLKKDVRRRDNEIDSLNDKVFELENRKDGSLKAVIITAVGLVLSASVTAGALIVTDDDPVPAPPPAVECSTERAKAKSLYRADDVWVPLPESSTVEEQCDINTYIVTLPDPKAP